MHRRDLIRAGICLPLLAATPLASVLALAATPGLAFDEETVPRLARALAAKAYQRPDETLTPSLKRLGYDQYRSLRYAPERALWRDGGAFQAQFFHRGFLFKQRVEMHEVRDGRAQRLVYQPDMFTFGDAPAPTESDLGFAGLRLHAQLNRDDYFDEVAAFLGASYFRAVASGQAYGLSARGLALNTSAPDGEEFPMFRAFWLQRPARGVVEVIVHALLDSPSVAGAFRFAIRPGAETVMEVRSRLYLRVALTRVGIAPLTSMFEFGANDRVGVDDYRPAVHDSDGLALLNGRDEQVWRPLHNPAQVQESAFQDEGPRGFGLMQRKRGFHQFADSEANYERRPSAWVEPLGDWGKGAVHLVEIPTANEYHDNIVAFWRPAQPLQPGREHRFDYRLHWSEPHTWKPQLATVENTLIGASEQGGRRLIILDLAGGVWQGLDPATTLQADVGANAGSLHNVVAHRVEATGGWRIGFELDPQGAQAVELHARLLRDGAPASETWLYRWTA